MSDELTDLGELGTFTRAQLAALRAGMLVAVASLNDKIDFWEKEGREAEKLGETYDKVMIDEVVASHRETIKQLGNAIAVLSERIS